MTRRALHNNSFHDFHGPLVLLVALALAITAYSPGVGGSFHFDDSPNLDGLSRVLDIDSALRFVAEGIAGPLGRPLALATFAPQAYAWPTDAASFLYVNICIHLLNGVLIVWALYLLSLIRGSARSEASLLAAVSGGLWMLLPILASSSLLIIQRMTTLSATFSLLGLIGYLLSRRLCDRRPLFAIPLMTLSLVVGASLAVLAKENGALLPLFVLIVECTLLSRPVPPHLRVLWNTWFAAVLIAPGVALLGYLVLQADYGEPVALMRGFSAADRLLTQAHVLWEYLYHAALPSSSALGPFHDDYPVYRNWLSPGSLLAVGGWIALLSCAALFRRRVPLLSFAVGWYLVGHSLESSTIPLELYFEHRNYLPLIGPTFALVSAAYSTKAARPIANFGFAAYGLLLAAVLFSTTSLWGRPALAGEMWFKQHPDSTRAVQYVGQQIYRSGDLHGVRQVLSRFAEKHPESSASALQALYFSCLSSPTEPHDEQIEAIRSNLAAAKFEYAVFEALRQLYRLASDGACRSLDRETVYRLTASIAAHPVFRSVGIMQHNLHMLMSEEGLARRDLDMTMRHIEKALEAHHAMTTLIRAVQMLVSAGLYTTALDFVEDAYDHEPRNPFRAARWKQELSALEHAIRVISHE